MAGYSDDKLWKKVSKFAKEAGIELIEKVLILYYALQEPDTPTWAKGVIITALAYFISPLDTIPDFVPGGYGDDLVVIAAALVAVALYITDEVKAKARGKLIVWFGKKNVKLLEEAE